MGKKQVSPERYVQTSELRSIEKLHAIAASIPEDQHRGAVSLLRDLLETFGPARKEYRELFFEEAPEEMISDWLSNPQAVRTYRTLHDLQLLPTENLVAFVQNGHHNPLSLLEETIEAIRGGAFDRTNELHVELEYSRAVFPRTFGRRKWFGSLREFSQLPMEDEISFSLDETEKDFARKHGQEAVATYRFIAEKIQNSSRTSLVIGNRRHGANYVVNPIRPYLEDIGCTVVTERIPSTWAYRRGTFSLTQQTVKKIKETEPDIFVVDGTKRFKIDEGVTTARFPAAMSGYIDEIATAYDYNLVFQSMAVPGNEEVVVGGGTWSPEHVGSHRPTLYIVCPTNESQGFFDNYNKVPRFENCFTQHGFAHKRFRWGDDVIVPAVQDVMKAEIAKHL
ncbi:MAG: hypothetical protein OXR66_00545 [Candidatus Woesearchaeota archaeon]|nr:hypothetical protein [Candidatus Woesearchaeota archaeon]